MKRDLFFFISHTVENGPCLEWTRCFNTDGYPRCSWEGKSNGKVHRIVWELANNKSADGLVIRHSCDNIRCINPSHLAIGTSLDNVQDRVQRNRTFKVITAEVVAQVRKMLQDGKSQLEIAEFVGINKRRVSDINCGRYDEQARLTRYLFK